MQSVPAPARFDYQPATRSWSFFRQHHAGLKITAVAVLIFAILVFRRPDLLLHSQFWAEDGAEFFAGQVGWGFGKAFVTPYAGYLCAIPRIAAGLCSVLPVRWIPLGFSIFTFAGAAFCCSAFSWPSFRPLIPSDSLRIGCCVTVAAVVPTGGELLAGVCTLQVYLSLVALLLIFRNSTRNYSADRRPAIEIPLVLLQVLIFLSAPVTLLYVPFLLWQVLQNRGVRKLMPLFALAVAAAQVSVIARSQAAKPNLNFNDLFLSTVGGGLSHAVLSVVLGASYLTKTSLHTLLVSLLIAFAGCVALASWLLLRADGWYRRSILLSAMYVAVGSVAFAMAGRNVASLFLSIDGVRHTQGERYFFLAACLFMFLLAVAIEPLTKKVKPSLRFIVMPALFALGIVQNFRLPPLADLSWQTYAAEIERWQASIKKGERPGVVVIPINPPTIPPMVLHPRNE